MSGEKILWTTLDYLYSPVFVHNELKKHLNDVAVKDEFVIEPIDNLDVPFTLDQVSMFLESCVSLMFFLQKNNILKMEAMKNDNDVELTCNILIKPIDEFNCLRNNLHFSPSPNSRGEIDFDSELRILDEYEEDCIEGEDQRIYNEKRILEFDCSAGPFSEKEIASLKYYPRSVGYNIKNKELILKKFKLCKEIKKEDYPLYVNMPYVQDYITYLFSRPKDDKIIS
jgi:hypothetical protein